LSTELSIMQLASVHPTYTGFWNRNLSTVAASGGSFLSAPALKWSVGFCSCQSWKSRMSLFLHFCWLVYFTLEQVSVTYAVILI